MAFYHHRRKIGGHMKAIVFDLDGTLIDSAADIHLAGNKVLAAEGLPLVSFEQSRGFVGHGAGVLIERMIAAVGADPARHAAMLAQFLQHYETAVHQTTLYPNVQNALTALQKDGWALAICTNKPVAPTRAVLAHFGMLQMFPVIFGGDSLPTRKPDPAPLLATIAALGNLPALFVGDSEVDAETAHRAAMPFALYTEGYRKTAVADLPHHAAFDDFAALPDLAAAWWSRRNP